METLKNSGKNVYLDWGAWDGDLETLMVLFDETAHKHGWSNKEISKVIDECERDMNLAVQAVIELHTTQTEQMYIKEIKKPYE